MQLEPYYKIYVGFVVVISTGSCMPHESRNLFNNIVIITNNNANNNLLPPCKILGFGLSSPHM